MAEPMIQIRIAALPNQQSLNTIGSRRFYDVGIGEGDVRSYGGPNLVTENRRLREEITKLRTLNKSLKAQVRFFTTEKGRAAIVKEYEESRHYCDLCEFAAPSAAKLKIHKERKHQLIVYRCDLCDYGAATSSILKQHKQSKHEGIRYPCDQCSYVSTQSSLLKRHVTSKHLGIKYSCDKCEYTADRKETVKQHMINQHERVDI